MRIYFAADAAAEEKLQVRFSRIVQVLHGAGVLVMSNLAKRNVSGFSSQDLEKMEQSGETMLERVDALVIEGTRPLAESGYLVALALTYKKPILYLLEKGKTFNQNLQHLLNDKGVARYIYLKNYSDGTLEKTLLEFLQVLEEGSEIQVPSIKFTLRITPRIERYLQWRVHNTKISKADYLRNMIEKLIDDDEQYQKFIKHQQD